MTQSAKTIKGNTITDIISTSLSGISGTPKVSSITYPGDDTAAAVEGGQTITLNGSGFNAGAVVLINNTAVSVVTVVNSTTITFTSPALSVGSYILYVINTDGGTGISVPGIQYSGTPAWTTSAGSLGSQYETTAFNNTLAATGDAPVSYSIASGSLPTGATLNSNGTITGTSVVGSGSPTTYTFTVSAIDAQNQDTQRQFSITINPDSVTWANPASDNSTVQLTGSSYSMSLSATSAANQTITYSANALPTGLTLSNGVISGISTVEGNTATLLTATASNTNRTSTRTINWTVSLGDAYWKYTSLVLTGTTPTPTFINDASLNNHQLTIQGDTKPNNFSPYRQGYYSVNLTDSVARFEYSQPALGNSFTIEFWVYPTVAGSNNYIYSGGSTTGPLIGYNGPTFSAAHQGAWTIASSSNPVLFTWSHIALVREGTGSNQFKLYINGVLTGTGTDATTFGAQTTSSLGGNTSSAPGYISNFRIVNNQALYTGTFTPSTAPLTTTDIGTSGANVAASLTGTTILLVAQSPRFVDKSTNNLTLTPISPIQISSFHPFTPNPSYRTYGSAYFDGTGDYLVNVGSTAMAFGMGDFTVEYWVYPTAFIATYQSHVGGATTSHGLAFGLDSSNRIYKTTQTVGVNGTTPLVANRWYHIAWTRSSGTARGFINGVQDYSGADATDVTETSFGIGGAPSGTLYPCGASYICDIRVVKGSALYTSTFTPPTAPLTAVANTSLLTLQYNGGSSNNGVVDQSSYNNIITRTGNTTQGTFSPYSMTGWSTYYNGTTDYQALVTNAAFAIGTADFTIECWAYPSTANQRWATLFAGVNYGNSSDWGLYAGDGTTALYPMFFFTSGSTAGSGTGSTQGATSLTSYTPLVVGAWSHIAVSRVSGIAKMFINGVQVGISVTATSWSLTNTLQKAIGGGYNGNSNSLFTGYISNLRIVSGTGVYTTTFTPPTAALSAISGTILLTNQSNRFIDNSVNNFALTSGGTPSVQAFSPFSGVTSVPTSYSSLFTRSATDYYTFSPGILGGAGTAFTVEFWMYLNSYDSSPFRTQYGLEIFFDSIGKLQLGHAEVANIAALTATSVVNLKTWYHVAVTRTTGNLYTAYINGVSVISATYATTLGTLNSHIGFNNYNHSLYGMDGYVSNFRSTTTVVYTGNFTPPSGPLTLTQSSGTNINAITSGQVTMLTLNSPTVVDAAGLRTLTQTNSPKPKSFNPFGTTNTTGVSYSPSVNGGSMYFDGTGDYLTVPNTAGNMSLGAGDFTIECWIYYTGPAAGQTYGYQVLGPNTGAASTGWGIVINRNTDTKGFGVVIANAWVASSAGFVAPNTWTHLAMARFGSGTNNLTLFLNGVMTSQATYTTADTYTATPVYVGSDGAAGSLMPGYISDVRITKGTALYASNFYPSFAPLASTATIGSTIYSSTLLLTGTSGGIIDYHSTSNLETVGNTQLASEDPYSGSYYSNYFDGTGDYFTLPVSANLAFAGDYTIEAWVYLNSVSGLQGVYSSIDNAGDTWQGPYLGFSGTSFLATSYISSADTITHQTTVSVGQWYHIAIVRNGSATKSYLNGVQSTGTTNSTYSLTQSGSTIGSAYPGTSPLNGYISNLRVVKGTAVYTTTFTPTNAPLTAISGTQLLICQSNKLKDNSTNNFTLTVTGDTKVKSMNPFQQNTGKSLYFDGTGDWMQLPVTPNLYLSSANFTIEGWIYVLSVDATYRCIFSVGNTVQIYSRSGTIEMYFNDSDDTLSYMINGTTGPANSIIANSWTHFAVVRNGTSWTAFVNGVAGTSVTAGGAVANSASNGQIGAVLSTYPFSGYIKDLRITKGYARYTTGFTPSVTAVVTS